MLHILVCRIVVFSLEVVLVYVVVLQLAAYFLLNLGNCRRRAAIFLDHREPPFRVQKVTVVNITISLTPVTRTPQRESL